VFERVIATHNRLRLIMNLSINWLSVALTIDGSKLLVHSWWSIFTGAIVREFSINTHALTGSNNCFVKESHEKTASNQGEDNDDHCWETLISDLIISTSDEFADDEVGHDIGKGHKEESNEHIHLSEGLSKVEFDQMLQVDDKSVPGTGTERVSTDSHVGISDGIVIPDNIFKAREAALCTSCSGVVTLSLNIFEKGLDESDDGHNERTKCNRSSMVDITPVHSLHNLCGSLTVSIGAEIVSGNTAHHGHNSLVLDVDRDPEESEEQGHSESFLLFIEGEIFAL
jgi:hypothetical protein